MKAFKIYLARPMAGFPVDEITQYFKNVKAELEPLGYVVYNPMTGKEAIKFDDPEKIKAHGYDYPLATDHAITRRDMWMVNQADIVYANFSDSDKVSIGTCMEIAWAYAAGKNVVMVLPNDNVHCHAFIHECATVIFRSPEEAMLYLKQLAK